ncbi:MAG: hypothetical protein ABSC20_06650 [Candidatus Bathyarchaeia archaeon]
MNGKPLVSIVSAGMSKFGKHDGLLAREIFSEAAKEAAQRKPTKCTCNLQGKLENAR